MIKQNETIEVHKVKLVKSPPEYITCPLCRKNVQSQAVGGHLNFKHNITGVSLAEIKTMTLRGEAKKILGELEIEGKKRLLDDAVYTIEGDSKKEIEGVSPANPGEIKDAVDDNSEKEIEGVSPANPGEIKDAVADDPKKEIESKGSRGYFDWFVNPGNKKEGEK